MPFLAEASIEIPVPPAVAFAKLLDFPSWDSWMPPSFRPARPHGPLRLGDRIFVRIGKSPSASPLTISIVDEPHTLAWRGGIGKLLFAEHVFRFEAKGAGTIVRSQEIWDGKISRFVRPLVKRLAERIGREQIEALARALR
ncbi:hypothetical protein BH09MYX1_BH09MYX1_63330 [soil metagenome]